MNWLQAVIYGCVSGLAEFLPISARAHQDILLYLYGMDGRDPIASLVLHIAVLFALYGALKVQLDQIKREKVLSQRNRRNRSGSVAMHSLADLRLVKNATMPMLLGMLLLQYIFRLNVKLPAVSLLLLINGILLYLPERMMRGNKNAFSMSLLDSYLMGAVGALSIVSGFSGIGLIMAVAISRGADRQKALNWALFLMIPALVVQVVIDAIGIFSGAPSVRLFSNFFVYILAAVFAYLCARAAILLIKRLTMRDNSSMFAYYCWGAALFSFMLYLSVV